MRTSMMARSGCVSVDHVEQGLGVGGAADDVVAGVDQQAGQPLAEQRRVLADHDPHGSTASIVVPAPGGLVMTQRATDGRDPVGQTGEPGAGARQPRRRFRRPAPAPRPRRCSGDPDVDRAGVGVLGRVGDRLGGHEVGGRRDVVVERLRAPRRDAPGSAACRSARTGRRAARRRGWWAAVRGRSAGAPRRRWPARRRPGRAARSRPPRLAEAPLRQPHRHPERHQPLLGAVVQVALEPAALGIADLDEPRAARLDLAQRPASSARSRVTSTRLAHADATTRSTAGPVASEPLSTPIWTPPRVTGTRPLSGTGTPSASTNPVVPGTSMPTRRRGSRKRRTQHGLELLGLCALGVHAVLQVLDRRRGGPPRREQPAVDSAPQPGAQRREQQRADRGRARRGRRRVASEHEPEGQRDEGYVASRTATTPRS